MANTEASNVLEWLQEGAETAAAESTVRQAGASPMAIQLAVVAAQQSVQALTLILPAGK